MGLETYAIILVSKKEIKTKLQNQITFLVLVLQLQMSKDSHWFISALCTYCSNLWGHCFRFERFVAIILRCIHVSKKIRIISTTVYTNYRYHRPWLLSFGKVETPLLKLQNGYQKVLQVLKNFQCLSLEILIVSKIFQKKLESFFKR